MAVVTDRDHFTLIFQMLAVDALGVDFRNPDMALAARIIDAGVVDHGLGIDGWLDFVGPMAVTA